MRGQAIELIEKGKALIVELEKFVKSSKEESDRFKSLPDGWVRDNELGIEWGPSSDSRMNWEVK